MVLSMIRWKGKVAVVTGAASGIGASVVDQLIEHGLVVVGVDVNSEALDKKNKKYLGTKEKFYPVKADVSKEEEVLEAFERIEKELGSVHILINCAGIFANNSLLDGNAKLWKKVLDINVIGVCICTREAIKSMRNNNVNGHIVHINSIAGHKIPNAPVKQNIYPASKYAITALTETLRQELNSLNSKIKITSVSPGTTRTNILSTGDAHGDALLKSAPLLEPEDVADGIIYVLSTPEHVQVHELLIKPIGETY